MRILLVYPAGAGPVDGIRDYASRSLEQLRIEGEDAALLRPKRGLRLGPALVAALRPRDDVALILQYNPFTWGRWGVAPSLVLAVGLVRVVRPRTRVLIVIHEGYVPMHGLRLSLLGLLQRLQLRVLLAIVHGALATTGRLTVELTRGWPHRRVDHLPVSSNLPDERGSRSSARAEAGYQDQLVVASFTTGHETHLHGHIARAAEAVAQSSPQPVVLLLLGSNNVPPAAIRGVNRTVAPGFLDARTLARALSTVDVFLAPFADGATTRRTTLMAAMQHGVATVTTLSASTETVLRNGRALAFAAPDDRDRFAAQAVRVATDAPARDEYARAGRALYDRQFSWPIVCARLRQAIATTWESSGR
jgi:glycosyltransferase involved in cell wall biosynthesis